jgi:hypothetical protein
MDDLSLTSISISNDKNENRIKHLYSRLSTVREDSQENDNQTIINEDDKQSDTSDFDIIESIDNTNELNEGI